MTRPDVATQAPGTTAGRGASPASRARARASGTRGFSRKKTGGSSRSARARATAVAGPSRSSHLSASQPGREPVVVSHCRGSATASASGGGPSRASLRRIALTKPAAWGRAPRTRETDSDTAACGGTRRWRSWWAPRRRAARTSGPWRSRGRSDRRPSAWSIAPRRRSVPRSSSWRNPRSRGSRASASFPASRSSSVTLRPSSSWRMAKARDRAAEGTCLSGSAPRG